MSHIGQSTGAWANTAVRHYTVRMDPLAPAAPPSRLTTELIAGFILVIIIAIGAFVLLRGHRVSVTGPHVEFVGAATSTWYAVSGTELAPVPASDDSVRGPNGAVASSALMPTAPVGGKTSSVTIAPLSAWELYLTSESGMKKDLGRGRPLGFLSDGSLLALTPLGLVRINPDGVMFAVIRSGGSETPLGAASADLSLVAIENQVTGFVDVYRVNPVARTATYVGSINVPHARAIGVYGVDVFAVDAHGALAAYAVSAHGLAPVAIGFSPNQ